MDIAINYWAVLAAAIASFIIGSLWYGPLFGKEWRKLRAADSSAPMKMPIMEMVGEFILTLITAYVLARSVAHLGATSWVAAMLVAVWIWIGFYATTLAGPVLWEKMPKKLYAINASRWLVSLVAMAVILEVWH